MMISFSKAIQTWLDNHSQEGQKFNFQKTSFFGSRTYVAYDFQSGWQIRELTFVQQLLRNFFGMYKETHKAYVQKAFKEIKISQLDLQDAKKAFIIGQIKRVFALQFDENEGLGFRQQAKELGSSLERIVLENKDLFNCWDRNSLPALYNLFNALKLYGENKDLTQSLANVVHGCGMSGRQQPNTVGETFKIAQNADGGFQSFLQYAKGVINNSQQPIMPGDRQHTNAKYNEFVITSEQICQLLPKLIEA